ncbi:MAG: STAS/SEC14 domain-containing protein [Longimicrobiales bacterium]|nr:STAS/SEC14 domain-containing protein [Longimicrobiales bacterium]
MVELLDLGDDRVIGLRVDGMIREEDMLAITARVEEALEQRDTLRAYVEVARLTGIEARALFEDLRLALRHWRKFERKAAVTDAEWIARVAEIVDPLFPSIEVRVFPTTEGDAARDWIRSE